MARTRALVSVLMLGLISAAPASAQDDGVTLDPTSPAGKEYVIPLESARGTGADQPAPASSNEATDASEPSSNAPLFGNGIKRASGSARDGSKQSRSRRGANNQGAGGRSPGESPAQKAQRNLRQGVATAQPAPFQVGLIVAAVAAAIALIGAARARRRRTATDGDDTPR
jgi:hypothetical protein